MDLEWSTDIMPCDRAGLRHNTWGVRLTYRCCLVGRHADLNAPCKWPCNRFCDTAIIWFGNFGKVLLSLLLKTVLRTATARCQQAYMTGCRSINATGSLYRHQKHQCAHTIWMHLSWQIPHGRVMTPGALTQDDPAFHHSCRCKRPR